MTQKAIALLGGLCVAVVCGLLADTPTTVALFLVLTPVALVAATGFGLHMLMLGDSAPRCRFPNAAIAVAVAGPPVVTLAVFVTAMVLAVAMTGRTFYVPLVAAAVTPLLVVGLTSLAGAAVRAWR